jgi:hypothetical protein
MAGEPVFRLDGWKAIADYLGRDVRTAQRWREERGMPVHRIPGGKGGAMFADRAELDAWLLQRSVGDIARNGDATPLIDDHPNVPSPVGPVDVMPLVHQRASIARRVVAVATGLIVVAGVAAAVIRTQTSSAMPVQFVFNAGTLTARAADDSVLWTFRPPEQPGSVVDGAVVNRMDLFGTARAMFHGGNPDVLALLSVSKVSDAPNNLSSLRQEIYCLSSAGKFRWMFSPKNRLTFAGREFAGPWLIKAWTVLPGPKPRLWVSFIDNVWWPSFIASVDPDGKAETVFVNSGHIIALAAVQTGGATSVLAGGVNNEYRSAALAVLDPDADASSSPQTNRTPFVCDQCPVGTPYQYFVFPRLEVAAARGVPYEFANLISAAAGAPIEVSIRDMTALNVRAVYRFSEALMPESVAMSDRYWELHREMSRNGTLDHSPENCPERNDGVVVRMWTPGSGWSTIKVLPTFAPRETR